MELKHLSWLVLFNAVSLVSAFRQCTAEDQKRDLGPGQCLTQCAGKDGQVTCPGDPPVTVKDKDCDFLTVVRGTGGEVLDHCCTKTPSEPSKNRPRCGSKVGWLECDPDNGFGSCCDKDGYCGSGPDYCGFGDGSCNGGCDKCPGPRQDLRCGKDFGYATCQQGQCCSARGFCGSTDKHCKVENGCQNGCAPKTPGPNRCGAQAGGRSCDPDGEFGGCCSKHGFCGTSATHCDKTQGCQSGCNDPNDPLRTPQDSNGQTPIVPSEKPQGGKQEKGTDDPDAPKGQSEGSGNGNTGSKDPGRPAHPSKNTGDDGHSCEDPDAPNQPIKDPSKGDSSNDNTGPGRETPRDPDSGRPANDSPGTPPGPQDGSNDPSKDTDSGTNRPKECPACPEVKCPPCPKQECPPLPKKDPASKPKLDSSDPNTIHACLCDEGQEPSAFKVDNPNARPQQTSCPYTHGQKKYINGQCYRYACYKVQTGGDIEREWGDSLEECGEICAAKSKKNNPCKSVNFFPSTTNERGVCRLHMGYGWNEGDPNVVFGGALTQC